MKSVHATWYSIAIVIIGILFLVSCKENTNRADKDIKKESFHDYLGKSVKIDIIGKVLDNKKKPVDGVTIILGNKTISTNKGGNFILKNVTTHENLVSIEVRKIGYKNALIDYTSEDLNNPVSIILHKETELCLFWFCKDNHNLD